MKFDVIIGNPPYQEKDGGSKASARPLYHNFIFSSKELNPKYISFIIPTRWYTGGKGLSEFRKMMLNDPHIKEMHDFLNPEEIFPNTNIRGGVCFYVWDKDYNNIDNLVNFHTYKNKIKISEVRRPMKIKDIDILLRDSNSFGILDKIFDNNKTETLNKYISSRKPFGLDTTFINHIEFKETLKDIDNPVICYGRGNKIGYVEKNTIRINTSWIDKWKVFTPRANNIGTELNDDNLNSIIGKPGTVCTESLLVVGVELDLDKSSSKSIAKYLKSKFLRYLHGLSKSSHDATSITYRFVPLQDFTENSDIDWSKSVSEIDKQLYKKYGLDEKEIEFIEKNVKPME